MFLNQSDGFVVLGNVNNIQSLVLVKSFEKVFLTETLLDNCFFDLAPDDCISASRITFAKIDNSFENFSNCGVLS